LTTLVQSFTDEATLLAGAQFGAFFYNTVSDQGETHTLYAISGVARDAFEHFPLPRSTELLGQCPHCHEWNTFVEERLGPTAGARA